ncbi:aquaporin-1-like [Asterias rubens]|uniref:aquaporin-1-like n=1 Tax=Asterias rubens TaxID=7604 RepID=UPI0014554A67|nr:aquaporin-1-like [Asterias rubens]
MNFSKDTNGKMPQVVDKMSEEIRSSLFWRACLAEYIATLFFVFLGLASTVTFGDEIPDLLKISLAFGLGIATLVHCTAHISGGHLNPAVTIAFLVTHQITPLKAILYILAQVLGGISASGILSGLTTGSNWETGTGYGVTAPQVGVMEYQALFVEMLLTFQLVFTVFSTVDPDRKGFTGSGPLAIGLSVALGHFAAIRITGASMNPARTLASAVISGNYTAHWVYWVGPILGGIIAASLYDMVLAPTATPSRIRKCISCEYDVTDDDVSPGDIDLSIINHGHTADETGGKI